VKDLLLKNLRLKILALAFAAVLWFFVAGQSNTEVGFLVTLGFKGIPRDLVMTSAPPAEVEVRVVGPKLFINNLSPTQIIAEFDLSGAKDGLNTYHLTPADIVRPMGINVSMIRPSSIDIRLEKLVTITLPVKVRLSGRPAAGYRVSALSVTPGTVNAGVLKRQLKEIDTIYTKSIDLTGLKSSTTVTVPLDIPERRVWSLSPEKVNVRLVIEKERSKNG
jgi:YbbR domain-containing protein